LMLLYLYGTNLRNYFELIVKQKRSSSLGLTVFVEMYFYKI
jgi:hypothetical protein